MAQTDGDPIDIRVAEDAARSFHAKHAPDAAAIWERGSQHLYIALAAFSGTKLGDSDNPLHGFMLALLASAAGTVYCSLNLASRGYYPQAKSLQRMPLECGLAYWYLRSFPQELPSFLDRSRRTPQWNEMLQALEVKAKVGQHNLLRAWIERLHAYAHVDTLSIALGVESRGDGTTYLLGPQQDAGEFRACAAEAVLLLPLLLGSVNDLRQRRGLAPLPAHREFDAEIAAWRQGRGLIEPNT
jgi:hypothetical protein